MEKEKKHYEIMVDGDGSDNFDTIYVDVYCTEDELQVIGTALSSYVLNFTDGGCCCIAKENGGVTYSNYDVKFSDCI